MSDRANQLQFLRFIAFCMIFLWHINAYAFSFIARFNMNAAAEAVSFFFILSGMVVAYSGYGKESECSLKSIGAFVWKALSSFYGSFLCVATQLGEGAIKQTKVELLMHGRHFDFCYGQLLHCINDEG